MKALKNLAKIVFALAIVITAFTVQANAADYTDEVVIMNGHKYTGSVDGRSETEMSNLYKLVVPSKGTVTINTTFEGKTDGTNLFLYVEIFKKLKNSSAIDSRSIPTSESRKIICDLESGTYYICVSNCSQPSKYNGISYYTFMVDYDFTTTAEPKVTSPAKGLLKVTASKGDKLNGYEIRYKVKGSKKWTTETLATKKTLNQVISGLTSGKKYTVQVRKYVNDSYGYTYYSEWSDPVSVKIK